MVPDDDPELGTRQYCRDNETMFSGHTVICYCNITIFGVANPSRHRDLNIFRTFSGPRGSITLSRCRGVALSHCRVIALSLWRSYTIVACPALNWTKTCFHQVLNTHVNFASPNS